MIKCIKIISKYNLTNCIWYEKFSHQVIRTKVAQTIHQPIL